MGRGGFRRRFGERSLAIAGVALAHVAVLTALVVMPQPHPAGPHIKETPLQWVLIPNAEPVPARTARHRSASPQTRPTPESRSLDLGTPAPEEPARAVHIDWSAEAASTAIHETERELAEERRRDALAHGTSPAFHDHEKAPEFHWDYAATHRVEASESGGYLLHINDQCVLVFAIMLMPACTLEKPAVRGDLFEHMKDPARPGDWKDK